jgi:hypothetical protein
MTTLILFTLQDDDSFKPETIVLPQALIEAAYYRDDDLANQIAMLDEELSGMRPKTAPVEELEQRLNYWLSIAAFRWQGCAR